MYKSGSMSVGCESMGLIQVFLNRMKLLRKNYCKKDIQHKNYRYFSRKKKKIEFWFMMSIWNCFVHQQFVIFIYYVFFVLYSIVMNLRFSIRKLANAAACLETFDDFVCVYLNKDLSNLKKQSSTFNFLWYILNHFSIHRNMFSKKNFENKFFFHFFRYSIFISCQIENQVEIFNKNKRLMNVNMFYINVL